MRIQRLLIANRGEIARRIQRSAKELGFATIAVFSDADVDAPFVRNADCAYRLGGYTAAESYLNIPAILAAAKATQADAIHPGYGFLSENAEFAAAVVAAGLRWVGPTSDAIAALGSKRSARELAQKLGVPVVPGYQGRDQSLATFREQAQEIGFPLLLKASAGGGGRGMRVVENDAQLENAYLSARDEARNAFGNDELCCEQYLTNARHIEVQLLADVYGEVVALGTRDCSMQRRHQKIVEEAPAPHVDQTTETKLADYAVRLARAVDYQNAGTAEFVLTPDGDVYFLEVNTRLQVEHPVTEAVYGVDLVAAQLRISCGEKLSDILSNIEHLPSQVRPRTAIELRLIAEDPQQDFLPQVGCVAHFHVPPEISRAAWFRVDSDLESEQTISPYYDSLLAKIIVSGADRKQTLQRAERALQKIEIAGVNTNQAYLLRLLQHPEFVAGNLSTHFLAQHREALLRTDLPPNFAQTLAAAYIQHLEQQLPTGRRLSFANTHMEPAEQNFRVGNQTFSLVVSEPSNQRFLCRMNEQAFLLTRHQAGFLSSDGFFVQPQMRKIAGETSDTWASFALSTEFGTVHVFWVHPFPITTESETRNAYRATMPGRVLRVLVAVGDRVRQGDPLLALEAMKMEQTIRAAEAGVVEEVLVEAGKQVAARAPLIRIGKAAAD